EVQQRRVVDLASCGAPEYRMYGEGSSEGVERADIRGDLCPSGHNSGLVLFALVEERVQVVGHLRLARRAPHHGIGPVAGDEVAPVLLHIVNAHEVEEVAPAAHYARHYYRVDHALKASVRHVEVGRIYPRVVAFPGKARLVSASFIE